MNTGLLPRGISYTRKKLPEFLENKENHFTNLAHDIFSQLHQELRQADELVKSLNKRIAKLCEETGACKRTKQTEGVGPLTDTALVAAIGDINNFDNGRHLVAWVGLVSRQYSSGSKKILLGISKRGDRYLRALLIHGA